MINGMTRGFFLSLCVAVLLSPALRAEDFFADLTAAVEAEFTAAAQNNESSLCIVEGARLLQTKANIREALYLMQQAYCAQLPLAENDEMRQALQEQFRRDVAVLRSRNMWSAGGGKPEETAADTPLTELPDEFDNEACIKFIEERRAELRAHQAAVREQLAAKGDADLLHRFDAAERAWEKYAEEGGMLYFCPIPGEAGNHTPRHAFFGITLPLYAHHERFLEKLAAMRK